MTETLETRLPERFIMQSLERTLGDLALRSCAPVALYGLLYTEGYIGSGGPALEEFCQGLPPSTLAGDTRDWSRPALSRAARDYGAELVSWKIHEPNFDLGSMRQAGYLATTREEDYYFDLIHGRSVEEIARDGVPLIVTMKPGFGTEKNRNIHAVTIWDWSDAGVTVIDPDGRNQRTDYPPERVLGYIHEEGAGTIVLPRLCA